MSLAFAALAATTLVCMLHAWRTPAALERTRFAGGDRPPQSSFSLIVPARHEQAVLETTLGRLAALDHPAYEVVAVVGHDDHETREVAERVAGAYPERVRVMVDTSWPKSKPRALNTALPACRGRIVGVFDAEDEVHPTLLAHIDRCFASTRADVVQGGVQLMNYRSSWYALRNVLEYYFWFRSRLHFHAEQRFIPLGGNTVFVRRDLLETAGGWDPDCLAEDCDLGVRLSAMGARTVVAYEPSVVTREETPHTLGALARQRTRWNQGFLQVMRKRDWRGLPPRQRALAWYTLAMPFFQAIAAILMPLAIVTILFLEAPIVLSLLSFLPLLPTGLILAAEAAGLRDFCRLYGFRARPLDYVRLVVGMFPYQSVLALAAARAVFRELRGVRNWEKTSHAGVHLQPRAVATGSESL